MQRERGGQSPGATETEIKAVIVGDGGCGKTSLLLAFARGDFPKVDPGIAVPRWAGDCPRVGVVTGKGRWMDARWDGHGGSMGDV